jgi:hypothetical protein
MMMTERKAMANTRTHNHYQHTKELNNKVQVISHRKTMATFQTLRGSQDFNLNRT